MLGLKMQGPLQRAWSELTYDQGASHCKNITKQVQAETLDVYFWRE